MKPSKNGRRIRKLRKRKGLSQYDLARLLQWSRSHIANLENGYRHATRHHASMVADALKRAR